MRQQNKLEHQVSIKVEVHIRSFANGTAGADPNLEGFRTTSATRSTPSAQSLSLPSGRHATKSSEGRRSESQQAPSIQVRIKRRRSADENASDGSDEKALVTDTTKSFHMGDIDGLKIFLKHRVDELTMRPLRGVVTAWLVQLKPQYVFKYK